jgi:hypothetical protein
LTHFCDGAVLIMTGQVAHENDHSRVPLRAGSVTVQIESFIRGTDSGPACVFLDVSVPFPIWHGLNRFITLGGSRKPALPMDPDFQAFYSSLESPHKRRRRVGRSRGKNRIRVRFAGASVHEGVGAESMGTFGKRDCLGSVATGTTATALKKAKSRSAMRRAEDLRSFAPGTE